MKKGLPILCLCLLSIIAAHAQSRLALYEEFSAENCFPCAAVNPGVHALTTLNAASVIHITYPSNQPIPGPLYTLYPAVAAARAAYYGITTAPQGRLNGTKQGSGTAFPMPGHAGNLTQADIDSAAMAASPFILTVSHAFNSTGDSVFITVTITAQAAYSNSSLKLRAALAEHLQYPTAPPGINGEQDFPGFVREMYPSAAGTSLASSWTASQTSTLTLRGTVQRYIDKSAANIVVWLQDDGTKAVLNAARSTVVTILTDAGISAARPPQKLICASGTANVAHNALLHNAGATTLTSAKIYYHSDATPVQVFNWSGSLGPGATTVVPLPALNVAAGGTHTFTDSVTQPNAVADINAGNNVAMGCTPVYNTIPQSLPLASGFEGLNGASPNGWILYDADSDGHNWVVAKNIFGTAAAGYGGSSWFLLHNNYYVPAGETNYAILPAAKLFAGTKTLSFAYAHAQFNTENDALDVVYSTDCGGSWTSVWNAAGSVLSTAPATINYFIPTPAQYMTAIVDMTTVPQGAMIAFRAVSDYGNSLYLDNILLVGPAAAGSEIVSPAGVRIMPNPAAGAAFADFHLEGSCNVQLRVVDAIGREVRSLSRQLVAGSHRITLPVEGLAPGVYIVKLQAAGQVVTTRMIMR